MPKMSLLNLQYNLSKKFSHRLARLGSQDRQGSDVSRVFQPNVDEMKRVFDKFDANNDGKISPEEYKSVLRALRKESAETEVLKIFKVADTNRDGFIDFNEFMDVQKGGGVRSMDIRSAFRTFDLDDNGRISAEEVLEVLTRLGETCNLEECRRMVGAVDNDGDGLIGLDDFMNMMTRSLVLA